MCVFAVLRVCGKKLYSDVVLCVHIHLGITVALCVSEVYCSLHVNTLGGYCRRRKLLIVRKNHSPSVMFIFCREIPFCFQHLN